MANEKEINALITLIDDPDEKIYSQIRDKLLSYGPEVIPALENFWENNRYGLVFQNRIENIIHQIQFDSVRIQLENWVNEGANDLLQGVLLVNRYQYPDLDEGKIRKKLNQLKQDVWLELNDNLTSFEQVKILNHILFEVHGFDGNKKNYHAPQNSYLNNVLESGKGNPLSLSIIYILLCEQLDIPIKGVNLPNHFVLCYLDELNLLKKLGQDHPDGVMFYINPFSRGTIFNAKEIEQFLAELKIKPRPEFFQPCDNLAIVRRLITNLIYSYEKSGYPDKVEELKLLYQCVDAGEDPNGTI
ncbi:MAG: transglutaminase-like domain-containing protein [Flavobacteriales bacterium]|nr:transglutaminase-like domain-containing protein [Flavobacteriales bacterium]